MSMSDCEIEYLDEDADLIQQCFQTEQAPEVHQPILKLKLEPNPEPNPEPESKTPLLVERRRSERQSAGKARKKRKLEEDDSDYDPSDDAVPPSPPESPQFKKKKVPKHVKVVYHPRPIEHKVSKVETPTRPIETPVKTILKSKPQPVSRKRMNIRIPDYDDPLCLPVKAVMNQESDLRKLENWNNVCLEHFRHCDTMLKPERGEAKSSVRSLVLRNVPNKQTGSIETTIWSKTSVENEEGDKKSEIFQCVLPRYKEKSVINGIMFHDKKRRHIHTADEAILTRENHKDGEVLVVYKPKDALSAVYKLFDKRSEEEKDADEEKMYLKEAACCKVCARCFQTSWRGIKKNDKKTKSILCPICGRTYVTVYNLLSHLKTHPSEDLRIYKKAISTALADIVSYHYKCRICQLKCNSIKSLLQHLGMHKCSEPFKCVVGNHVTN